MADGTFPTEISADRNANIVTNPVFVRITDGTANIGSTGNALDVNVASGSVTVTATDLDIRNIVYTQDSILIYANTAKDGSGTDYVPIVDVDGKLIISNPGGTEYVEQAVATATAVGNTMLVERDDVLSTLTALAGDWSKMYCDSVGALWVNPGTVTIASNYGEDSTHVSTDVGDFVLAVRNDVLASLTQADGDYAPFQVNADGALYVEASGTVSISSNYGEDATHASTDVGDFVLAVRNDVLATLVSNDGDYAPFQVDADGALYVNSGTVTIASNYGEDATHATTDTGDFVLAVRNDVLASLVSNDGDYAPFQVNALGALYVSIDGTVTVSASQLDVDDLNLTDDAVKVSGNSTANSETNPIFVKITDTVASGEELHDYRDSVLAGDASGNHTYAVTGATMFLKSVICSSSGGCRFEVTAGPIATLVSVAVGFVPRHGGTVQLFFDPAVEIPIASTGSVQIQATNREGSSQSVYTTIIGNDV